MPAKPGSEQINSVVITGDVAKDTYIYEGERMTSRKDDLRATKVHKELGGAELVYKVLDALNRKAVLGWNVTNAVGCPEGKGGQCISSYSHWDPFEDKKNKKQSIWRMSKALGYGFEDSALDPAVKPFGGLDEVKKKGTPKILVIQDAGYKFRALGRNDKWLLEKSLDWVVIKLSRPLAAGELWEELIGNYADKLVVIVSVDEFRLEDIKIAKGFSWEQTIEDLRYALGTEPRYAALAKCGHLIVSFGADGALWLDNGSSNDTKAKFLGDTSRAENEWANGLKGESFGYMSTLTAAVTYALMDHYGKKGSPDLAKGIERGLSAMRDLLENGHGGLVKDGMPSGFPVERLAEKILKAERFLSSIIVPWIHPDNIKDQGDWMIAEMMQRSPSFKGYVSLHGLATQVVMYGQGVLKHIPHATFGKLTTADRKEIETLRRLKRFMTEYKNDPDEKKPKAFGVFGPPGAGKSFGVKQIAKEVLGDGNWLEFNLSQFESLSELYGAFHQVRDSVLGGSIPVVFMDEFDSQRYKWLQYLISPMQDGIFQEGQLTHTVGKCIFIFAGATSYTYESFGTFKKTPDGIEAEKDFILKKGPDFKSRLDTYYNVLGPNRRIIDPETGVPDPADISCPLRRAIFISSKIKYSPGLPAPIDPGLVNALLRISKYKHGARSLDKLLCILGSKDKTSLLRSSLPADAQLGMYVDPAEFNALLLEPHKILRELPIEDLARAIHTGWSLLCDKKGLKKAAQYDKEYNALDADGKEVNRAAARRIQEILATVNLKIEKPGAPGKAGKDHDAIITGHLEHHSPLLAELEHNGWMNHMFKSGWKYADIRNDAKKEHDQLKPYNELPEDQKDKDRDSINNYPAVLKTSGYSINWIK
ncbi:MAG: AAA family ATPase [Candidatus Omnitrophica bacterium]|nr:AAA family ATPase [Candidatus Omnitrophota bacterium]